MPCAYTVRDGEHLSGIAEAFGFQDAMTLWNAPENAALRELRDSPDVLMAGDIVQIPDLQPKTLRAGTGTTHNITVRTQRLELRLTMQDALGTARGDVPVEAEVANVSFQRTSDGDGHVSLPVPRRLTDADVSDGEDTFHLRVGALDPATEPSGVHARLVNLGYLVGSSAETEPLTAQIAIEEFELDNDLPITGEVSGATLAKLVEVHGS